MTLNQTGSLKPGTSGQSIQQIQQKKIDDLEGKVTELQEAIENLTGIIDNYADSFSTGAMQAEKNQQPRN
jgi:predicted translin family RNA/ssDNA-binding protein